MPEAETGHSAELPGDEFHRLVYEHAGVALIATDRDLRIRAWNSAAGRVFGAAGTQMLGTPILSILPAADRDKARHLFGESLARQAVGQLEFRQRDREGGGRHFAVAVAPIVDSRGLTLGVSASVRDITRRAELLEEVIQGRKMRALGEMAGALAHHFNNILGGLVTSVDFALAQDSPDIEHRVLEQTARQLGRATRLVENLLVFAEGHRRRDDLGDLTEVLLQAIGIVEPELARAQVELELDLRTVPVTAVPRQPMLTLLFNLVHNAVDAMPDGGTLKIELQPFDSGTVIRLHDTGCGIPEEQLDRIFEPFFTTKNPSEVPSDRAAGFGLAVAHRIIEELSGRISVSSDLGKGTTFEIWLPFMDPLSP